MAVALLFCARGALAADVELAPFAGIQFPGYVNSKDTGRSSPIGIGLDYGATLDVEVADGWRLELLYSRQATDVESRDVGPRIGLVIERYLAGIEQEKDVGDRTRFFGVFLAGLTRFVPDLQGYDSHARFTAGLGLGVKHALSKRFGLRADARGFFVEVDSEAGFVCRGGCLFVFSGSGLWQGDMSAGVTMQLGR
jgi:hypothetical protein